MTWLKLLAGLSLAWLMFVEGLGVSALELKKPSRRSMLLRGFIAIDVAVPAAAWLVVTVLRPERPVVGALVLLAACPIAPVALMRISKAGGRREIATTLHLVLAALSVLTLPLTFSILGGAFGFEARVAPAAVARQVMLALILPLSAGLVFRAWWPETAKKLARRGSGVALGLLGALIVLVFVVSLDSLSDLGLRAYAAMAAFVALALLIGHVMARKDPRERTVFALETASRNLGLAFFIASVNDRQHQALPILVPYVVVFFVITAVYLRIFATHHPVKNVGRRV